MRKRLQHFKKSDAGNIYPWSSRIDYYQWDIYQFTLAGVSFHQATEAGNGEHMATLAEEPDNPHDPNAIKVEDAEGRLLGYVPKGETESLRQFTPLPAPCYVYIGRRNGNDFAIAFTEAPDIRK